MLKEAFSRPFIVFVIMRLIKWQKILSARKQRKASFALHAWGAKKSVPTAEELGSAMHWGSAKPQVKHAARELQPGFCYVFGQEGFTAHKCHVFHIVCSGGMLLALGCEGG